MGLAAICTAIAISIRHEHPYVAGSLFGAGALLVFVTLFLAQKKTEPPSASQNTQSTSDSLKQSQAQNANPVAIGRYEEHHHRYPPPVAADQQLHPNLRFVKPTKSRIESRAFGPEVLTKSENGEDAAGLLVANDAAGAGAGRVNGVRAQIVFRDNDNEVYGGFGAWLDEFKNSVDFPPGKRRELVVAVRQGDGNIYAVTNPRERALSTRRVREFVRALENAPPLEYRLLPDKDLSVAVTLIDSDGAVLREKQFNYERRDDGDFRLTAND